MPKITLDLPQHWIDLIEREVASGRGEEPLWVVAEALGLLEDELVKRDWEALTRKQKATLRAEVEADFLAAIDEGLADIEADRVIEIDDLDAFMDSLAPSKRAA